MALELAQAAAKKVGFDVQIQLVSTQEATDRAAVGDYDLTSGIWTTNTADVLWIRYSSDNITTPERRGQNGSYTRDDELDGLLVVGLPEQVAAEDPGQAGGERVVQLLPGRPRRQGGRQVGVVRVEPLLPQVRGQAGVGRLVVGDFARQSVAAA